MFKVFYLVFILVFCGCNSISSKKPKNVLSDQEMIMIIRDIQLIESAHKDISGSGIEKKAMLDTSYAIVFNKYKTSASQFDSSLSYYTTQPKKFEIIMHEVEQQLAEKK